MKEIDLEKIWMNSIEKFNNIEDSTCWTIGKYAMLEAIKQALEMASENAMINCKLDYQDGKWVQNKFSLYMNDYNDYTSCTVTVNMESILGTINQIK